jgi:Holliday junction resolvasome RuvABC endonuclease subunit
MALIRIAGLDGSLRNFGIANMTLDTETMQLAVTDLVLVETVPSKAKKVRKSSDNLERAQTITRVVRKQTAEATICFAEVPSGGQSYDAVLGFGIVIGIYASVIVPMLEVSPSETKMAAIGTKTASKQEIIDWAFERFPDAPWLTYKKSGVLVPNLKNEHLADAVAIVHAGIQLAAFQQLIAMMRGQMAA